MSSTHRASAVAEQALEGLGHLQRRLAVQPSGEAHGRAGAVGRGRDVHLGAVMEPTTRPPSWETRNWLLTAASYRPPGSDSTRPATGSGNPAPDRRRREMHPPSESLHASRISRWPSRAPRSPFCRSTPVSALPAQAPPLVLPKQSPRASVGQTVGLTEIAIRYDRPAVNGREIWGKLVPFDIGLAGRRQREHRHQLQLAGDGSAGHPLPAGRYGLHMIPSRGDWTDRLQPRRPTRGAASATIRRRTRSG